MLFAQKVRLDFELSYLARSTLIWKRQNLGRSIQKQKKGAKGPGVSGELAGAEER